MYNLQKNVYFKTSTQRNKSNFVEDIVFQYQQIVNELNSFDLEVLVQMMIMFDKNNSFLLKIHLLIVIDLKVL